MLHAVIMAGGAGTRFWPESRADRPKQLLKLSGNQTLLQNTLDRLSGVVPLEQVLVMTAAHLVDKVAAQIPDLAGAAIFGEPCKRDTAPCIGMAAIHLLRNDPDATMLVMPSDHVIEPATTFQKSLLEAVELVEEQPQRIVTFGIRPTFPAETFGYIECGELLKTSVAITSPVFHVVKFREKPPADVARQYVAAGNFYWNAGIFVWKAKTIADELARRQPEMYSHLEKIAAAIGQPDYRPVLDREFSAIKGISIDFAVMEHATNVAVIEAPFTWDDVGSWQAFARLHGTDADGNTIVARHVGVNTTDSIIRSTDDHLIATLGLKDCLIVHTPDATLVANKKDEEAIRRLVKLLEERGWKEFL